MDKELDKFLDDLANNTPNADQFDKVEGRMAEKVI